MDLSDEELDLVLKERRTKKQLETQWDVARAVLKASLIAVDRLQERSLSLRGRATQGACLDFESYRQACGENGRVRMVLGECGSYELCDSQRIIDECNGYIRKHGKCEE